LDLRINAELANKPTEANSGLESLQAARIRDSANKLRSKMQANALKHTQKTIDLQKGTDAAKQYSFQDLPEKKHSISYQKPIEYIKEDASTVIRKESPVMLKSIDTYEPDFIENKEYDTKITFSADRYKNPEIKILEEKLQHTENIVLSLQDKIDNNMKLYKERYDNKVQEIQELEKDNIELHQIIKDKINEVSTSSNMHYLSIIIYHLFFSLF